APAPTAGLTVALKSSNSKVAVPSTVKIAGGKSSATFAAATQNVSSVTPVNLTATYSNISKTSTLTVNPVKPSAVTLSASSVKGGASTTARVQINGPAPAGGVDVTLSSSSSLAKVPHTIHINAGSQSATLTVTTSSVKTSTVVTITAGYLGANVATKLTVHP